MALWLDWRWYKRGLLTSSIGGWLVPRREWTCIRPLLETFEDRVSSNFRTACRDIRSSYNICNVWAYISWDRSNKIGACTYGTVDDCSRNLFRWDRRIWDISYITALLLDIERLVREVDCILHSIANGGSGVFGLIAKPTVDFLASLAANFRVQSLEDTSTVRFRTKLIVGILLIKRLLIKKYESVVLMLL